MARPVKADAAATRDRILGAAIALFSDRGLDGASIRTIAGAAGVSLAMVHHYFGSKDGLYEACIERMYDQVLALQPQVVEALATAVPGDLSAAIDAVVRGAFRFARAHQVEGRLLLRQVISAGELDQDRRDRAQIPFLDQVTERLAAILGRPAQALRMPLQSLIVLVSRYGISTDGELELFSGAVGDAAVTAVEDHLVRTAQALLLNP